MSSQIHICSNDFLWANHDGTLWYARESHFTKGDTQQNGHAKVQRLRAHSSWYSSCEMEMLAPARTKKSDPPRKLISDWLKRLVFDGKVRISHDFAMEIDVFPLNHAATPGETQPVSGLRRLPAAESTMSTKLGISPPANGGFTGKMLV